MITGRFAPTPSGPLHFGSLIAALGSYLHAKHQQGRWLLRIDDLDTPRVVPNADQDILHTLERFGLEWDDSPIYQSQHLDHYESALKQLADKQLCYPCACSRQQVGKGPYPGTCRNGLKEGQTGRSIRFLTKGLTIQFYDERYGDQIENLETQVGDFVIKRADHIFAYHLATVVDDAAMGVTEVVRGADLLDSTARQIALQQALELPHQIITQTEYCHLPLMLDMEGKKLGKSTGALPLDKDLSERDISQLLVRALEILQQSPPEELRSASPATCLEWAIAHWQVKKKQAESNDQVIISL